MKALRLETYDPRKGREFVVSNYSTGKKFSSLAYGFYVLECIGPINWPGQSSLVTECILKTSRRGFFTLVPWSPGANKLRKSVKDGFGILNEFEGSLSGYFDPRTDSVDQLLNLRGAFGGNKSGVWCVGGCLEEFTQPARVSLGKGQLWDFSHILGQPERIGCAFDLGEMSQVTIISRIFQGFDSYISRLITGLSAEESSHPSTRGVD